MSQEQGQNFGPEFEEDKELSEFLLSIKKEFWENGGNGNIEKAAISLVERLGEKGMKPLMPVVERHFIKRICTLHDIDLVCDGNKLLGEDDDLSIAISRESLKEHMKWFLGGKEWNLIEEESANRTLLEDKQEGGTAG